MVATGNYLRWNTFFIVSLHVLEKILQKTWDNSTLRKNLLYKKSPSELWEKSIWSWRVFSDFSMKILTKFILGKVPCGSFPIINLVVKNIFSENHSNFWPRSTFSLRFFCFEVHLISCRLRTFLPRFGPWGKKCYRRNPLPPPLGMSLSNYLHIYIYI